MLLKKIVFHMMAHSITYQINNSNLQCSRSCPRYDLEISAMIFHGWEGADEMKASKFSDTQKAYIVKRDEEGVM